MQDLYEKQQKKLKPKYIVVSTSKYHKIIKREEGILHFKYTTRL